LRLVKKFKGGNLFWVSLLFLGTGFAYVVHAASEVLGLGRVMYAATGFVVTLFLAFTLVIIDITTQTWDVEQ
jgi:hypothetical protein